MSEVVARKRRSHRRIIALFISLVFAASCSKENPFEAQVKNLPRRFQISGKGYLLNEQEPGVIDDDAIVYTADAGARTFNFKTRTVLRHLFVGRWETFASLPQIQPQFSRQHPTELESRTASLLGKRSDQLSYDSQTGVHLESRLATVALLLCSGGLVSLVFSVRMVGPTELESVTSTVSR